MVTLKPCPFCGSAVRINHDLWGEPDGIWCGKCHMFVRWPRIRVEKGETFGNTMERIAKVWNGRYDDGSSECSDPVDTHSI